MSVQVRQDNNVVPFIRSGFPLSRGDAVIEQDALRSLPLEFGTVVAKVAANGKWTPFTDEGALDGTAIPQGIFVGSAIPAATIAAGDVSDVMILVGAGVVVAEDQVVLENSKTLDTVITSGSIDLRTVRDWLAARGIFTQDTIAISNFANV